MSRRAIVVVVGLTVALAACSSKATSTQASSPSPGASPSPSPSASVSPGSPVPSPYGCIDVNAVLDAMTVVRTNFEGYVLDNQFRRTATAAAELKRANSKMQTVEALVAVDPGLETQAQALAADIVLGTSTDPTKQSEEGDAFARIPTEFAMLNTAIQQHGAAQSC